MNDGSGIPNLTRCLIWKDLEKAGELFRQYHFDILRMPNIHELVDGSSYLIVDGVILSGYRNDVPSQSMNRYELVDKNKKDGYFMVLWREELIGLGPIGYFADRIYYKRRDESFFYKDSDDYFVPPSGQ